MKLWSVADIMRRDVATVTPDAPVRRVADLLVSRGVSAVPVVGAGGQVLGVVSEADLLARLEYRDRIPHHPLALRRMRSGSGAAGETAAEIMSTPAITIDPDASLARAARLMDAARVKRLPVVDAAGRLVGVVARRDIVRLYVRPDDDIRAEAVEGLRAAGADPLDIAVHVRRGVVTLRGLVDEPRCAALVVAVVTGIPGVVDVRDELSCVGGGTVAPA